MRTFIVLCGAITLASCSVGGAARGCENPYKNRPVPGWGRIETAPHDGTTVEIANSAGWETTYGLYRWADGEGWARSGPDYFNPQLPKDWPPGGLIGDGPWYSWRPFNGDVNHYVDPTHGKQYSDNYFDAAFARCGVRK